MGKKTAVSTGMIILVFAAFVSIGLPDALFGTAWPAMRAEFNMPNAAVGLLNIPGSLAYMASSAMLGTIMQRLSTAQLLTASTAMVGLGLTIYATAPSFWAIVPAVVLIAFGSGAIDAALNLFAAEQLPARYMSWLHAFYGIGALAGPFVMAMVYGMGRSWRWGYATMALILWVMALVFVLTRKLWATEGGTHEHDDHGKKISGITILRLPRVQLSLIMVMGGAVIESLASLWIASILIQRFQTSESRAALGVGVYWIGLTGARLLVPVLWPRAGSIAVQRSSTLLVILAAILMVPQSIWLSSIGILLVGIGIASIFPVAMTISAVRFGPAVSKYAIGYLISSSTIMFAILPPLSGWLADRMGFQVIPLMMLAGALFLLGSQIMLARNDSAEIRAELRPM